MDLGLPTPSLLCPELSGKRQEACGGRKGPPATASSLRHTRRRAAHWGDLLPRARCPLCLCPARCNQLQGTRSGCAAARALRTAGPAERPRRRTPGRWGEGPREEHPSSGPLGAGRGRVVEAQTPRRSHWGGRKGLLQPERAGPPGSVCRPQAIGPAASKVQPASTPPAVPNCLWVCPLVKPFLQHPLAKRRRCRSARFPPQPGEGALVPLSSDSRRPPAPSLCAALASSAA